jgi:hypothetical protein
MSRLSFKLFCTEKYADKHNISGSEVYKLFESKGVLGMLDEDYDVLHGHGFEYVIGDIERFLAGQA